MTTQTLVSFQQIIDFAKKEQVKNTTRFSMISYEEHLSLCDRRPVAILNFTLHGDYVGSTVEKSNYYVLQDLLKELYENRFKTQQEYELTSLFELNENYLDYSGGYSTYAIAIIGDLPALDWQVILEAIESVEQYPLLDEDHYSSLQLEDCWESWTSWQYFDIVKALEDHDLHLDSDEFHAIYEANNTDRYGWLWNIVMGEDLISTTDDVEITEVNAQAYYDFDIDDDDFITELANYIKQNS